MSFAVTMSGEPSPARAVPPPVPQRRGRARRHLLGSLLPLGKSLYHYLDPKLVPACDITVSLVFTI